MKASIEWLKDYSDIDIDSVKLGDILTMTGSKVETIEQKGNDIKNVVVGKILEIKKHEDSDHLVVTQVDLGNEKVQIVTGADNIKVGDIDFEITPNRPDCLSIEGLGREVAVSTRKKI